MDLAEKIHRLKAGAKLPGAAFLGVVFADSCAALRRGCQDVGRPSDKAELTRRWRGCFCASFFGAVDPEESCGERRPPLVSD